MLYNLSETQIYIKQICLEYISTIGNDDAYIVFSFLYNAVACCPSCPKARNVIIHVLERRPHSVCPHQKVKIHGVAYIHIIASETAVCVTADKHSLMCHVTEERGHGKFCRRYLPAFVSCFRIFEQHVAAIYVMLAVICLGHVPQSLRYHHVVRVYHYDDIPIGICYAFIESIAYAFILSDITVLRYCLYLYTMSMVESVEQPSTIT